MPFKLVQILAFTPVLVAGLPAPLLGAEAGNGPVFVDYGRTYAVSADVEIPQGAVFKVAFDISSAAAPGTINRQFDSAARFINMHVAAGVPLENIHLALVVHGPAAEDLLTDKAYAAHGKGDANGNAALVSALLAKGVRIILCGQSAGRLGLASDDVIPGVELALSAMTAHALLQQDGYTLNPF